MSDLVERFAPDFTLPTANGGRFSLSEWRGQPIVIVFWSATCAWSRRADVMLVYRQLKWGQRNVRIVAVASHPEESAKLIQLEAETRGLRFPIALDAGQMVARQYYVDMTPSFFVVDSVGMIRYAGAADDATPDQPRPAQLYLDNAVSALLDNRYVAVATTRAVGCPLPGLSPA